MDINRGRLIQERWLSVLRWLLIEASLLQGHLLQEPGRLLETGPGLLFLGFVAYTFLVSIMSGVLRSWPVGLAYITAAVDTMAASVLAALWPGGLLNPGIVGVVAAGVGVGVRRLTMLDTFAYSLLTAVCIVAARFIATLQLPLADVDALIVGAVAMLPVLARAATLAPQQGVRDDPMARLLGPGAKTLTELESSQGTDLEAPYYAAAKALAAYADSAIGAVLLREPDQSLRLYTVLTDAAPQLDRLPAPTGESLASRLLGVREATIFSRGDDLNTRGLPDQYPPILDTVIVAPILSGSVGTGALFAVNPKSGAFRPDDRLMTSVLAREVARLRVVNETSRSLTELRLAATEALLAAAEAKRPGSRAQAEECARYAGALATELSWTNEATDELRLAALLHDVGELAIPDGVLDKAEGLSESEFELVKVHPRAGVRMIDYFNRSALVARAVYNHHEHWDGQGYPAGLVGDAIPIEARIMTLADALESMLRPKVYRPALQPREAVQEIVRLSGSHFDPSLVQTFLTVLGRQGEQFLGLRNEPAPRPPGPARHRGM